ncbi:MAG: tRNA dihydrouridine synthase [Desulfobulbales bacterium]
MARKSIVIRQLKICPPLLLAPMAGLTHSALRSVLASFGGIGLFATEMLSARRLPTENPAISPYLITTSRERPLSYQLLVTTPDEVGKAVDTLHRFGADAIDLNLGCPAPRIRMAGGGGSLMHNRQLIQHIVRSARKRTELPLTAKIRLGRQLDKEFLKDFCLLLENEGIDLLTVHARLLGEKFCQPARWEWIGYVREWLSIPVVANGSITTVGDARSCLAVSGADGLMIGRAAPQRPWVFADIAREVYGCDVARCAYTLPEIYLNMVQELTARFGVERRLGRLKEFTHYFAGNYSYGHHLAAAVQSSTTMQEAVQAAVAFFQRNDDGGLRKAGSRQDSAGGLNESRG